MFSSAWGNNQTQQQPATSNAFGQQPSAFGGTATTGGTFGSTSAFGQPQQPAANPMFGNLGATNTTTPATGTGFGTSTFGGTTANSAFGTPKPATGFGAFGGGTSTFGTTPAPASAFGQPANNTTATSVFGQPAASTSTFGGTGTGLFGNTNKTSTFGTTPLGGTAAPTPPTITTGSSNPPYIVTTEKDGTTNLQFQSISCMPAYIGYSFEEIRVQDYAQNRKAASAANTFGGTAFGAPAATTTFGQPAQQQGTSLFGNTNTSTNTTAGGFGGFGQPAQPPAAAGTSLFGGTGTSTFGQPQQQQQTQPQQSAFGGATTGAFGQQQQPQQQQGTGLFGGTSTFGNNAAKPFGTATGTTQPFGTTSLFNNTQNQQQPAQGTGLFGNTNTNPTPSAFGGFGNNNAPKPAGIFGTANNTTQPAANPFGGFGGQQQQPQQQQTSLFGNTGGTGLFGNTQNQQQQPQATSLFGTTQNANPTPSLFGNTGSGLFGNTQANQQNQQGTQQASNPFGSLTAPKPAQSNTGLGLFGNTGTQQSAQQGSLFGGGKSPFGNPTAPGLGTSMSTTPAMNTNIFGHSTALTVPQPSLTASIAQPIGDNLPIFDMLPPGPRIIDLDSTLPKKKAGFFMDAPTRSPVPRVQLGYTPANSKLRGFGSSGNLGTSNSGGLSLTNGKPGALMLNKSDMRASSVGPDFLGRSGSPALGSGGRQSVKKVILDKKVDPSELFVKTSSPGGSKYGKVTFSAQLSFASRERDAQQAAPAIGDLSIRQQPSHSHHKNLGLGTPSGKELLKDAQEKTDKNESELEDGDYYLKPDLATLKKAGYDDLSAFPNLVVGRKGYGEIHFLEPVDLTGLPKLGALLGDVIRFESKECSVYPDIEDSDKPPPGSGLNVSARLILVRCWPQDKATREPITDANHPQMIKHLKRLKGMKNTQFEDFEIHSGTWTFTVDHF